MERLNNLPGARWVSTHPRLAAWIVLSVGIVILLFINAGDAGLQPLNWVALIVASVGVAGLCVWIVSWEDENDVTAPAPPESLTNPNPPTPTEEQTNV